MDGAGAVLTARWHLTGGCRHGCPLSRDAKALGSRPGERWAAVPRGTALLCGGRVTHRAPDARRRRCLERYTSGLGLRAQPTPPFLSQVSPEHEFRARCL